MIELVVLSLLTALPAASFAHSTPAKAEPVIQWLEWEQEAFDRAIAEDKLILLDLTAVWCHACHVMDARTYSESSIVTLLNTKFIPIRVDTDQRPDIESRYRSGGWPTTSILLPTGEILFQANSMGPAELSEALRESEDMYRLHKSNLVNRAQEIWEKVEQAKKNQKPPKARIDPSIPGQAIRVMQESYDTINGGFRDAPKFFEPEAITLAFHLDQQFPQENLKQIALFTLDQQMKLIDPVWGGFYRYATQADWSHPHYEKMLNIQALNLLNYLEAYQVTGDKRYQGVVEGTVEYVNRFLRDQKNGGFYASQDAVVRSSNTMVPGEDYFPLNKRERLAFGIPLVDRSIFTGWNGLMVSSYLKIFQVSGHKPLKEFALKTLDRLWTERYVPEKGLAHGMRQGQPRGFGWLEDQVNVAKASIEAFMTTNDKTHLNRAEQLADYLVKEALDYQGGGFFDRPSTPSDRGLLKFPSKPLEVNIQAAMLFCDLYYLTLTPHYREKAERTIQYVLDSSGPLPIALTALGVDRFHRYPVHIVIIGDKAHRETRGLFQEGLRLYSPGKIVRSLDPHHDVLKLGEITFPNTDEPTAYICTDKLCSAPVHDPKNLSPALTELLKNLNTT
jgi:uncharacterized protein YyaL (SSP411 family)